MKCDICGKQIEKTFLDKIKGTYIKIRNKRKIVCDKCQSKLSKEEIINKLS